MTTKQLIEDKVNSVLDDIVCELGCEPYGYKTWAKTTDEIAGIVKPILTKAFFQVAEQVRKEEKENSK